MSWDPLWEKIFSSQEWGKYPAEALVRFIARSFYQAENRQDIKLLEVGCGPGANLWYMAREGFSTYGIDGSDSAIQQAKTRLDKECDGWQGQLLVGDMRNLDFEDNSFDAVIDNEATSTNSFEDTIAIFGEMYRVTKPGGLLYSRTFTTTSAGDRVGKKVGHNAWIADDGPFENRGYTRFTAFEEIEELTGQFEIDNVELLTWSFDDRKSEFKEWIILGKKS